MSLHLEHISTDIKYHMKGGGVGVPQKKNFQPSMQIQNDRKDIVTTLHRNFVYHYTQTPHSTPHTFFTHFYTLSSTHFALNFTFTSRYTAPHHTTHHFTTNYSQNSLQLWLHYTTPQLSTLHYSTQHYTTIHTNLNTHSTSSHCITLFTMTLMSLKIIPTWGHKASSTPYPSHLHQEIVSLKYYTFIHLIAQLLTMYSILYIEYYILCIYYKYMYMYV